MRHLLTALLASVVVLLPLESRADTMTITLVEPAISFGPGGAEMDPAEFHGIYLDGVEVLSPGGGSFEGEVQFLTGVLEDLSLTTDGLGRAHSTYDFGPGTLAIHAHWSDIGGDLGGDFVGELLDLTIDLCEQQLSDEGACGDVFGDSQGEAAATLGASLAFDPQFAHALGLVGLSGGFFFEAIDGVSGGPTDTDRRAGSASGEGSVELDAAVPEPLALSLLCVSGLGALGRRGLRRRRRPSAMA